MNSSDQSKLQHAMALHGRGDPAQAALVYADILRTHPEHPDALHLLGVAETQRGRAQHGLDLITRSLAVDPDQPVAITNQGNALLSLHRAAEALASYDRALRSWPNYPLAVFGRANALAMLGRTDEALSSYERALELSPNFPEAQSGRGRALLRLNRPVEALAAYDRAIHLSPGLALAHWGRGAALLAQGAYGEALDSVDRALQLNPNLADAWATRGIALSLEARFADAAASLRQAVALDPRQPYARGACLHAQLQICDWTEQPQAVRDIAASVARHEPADYPFAFLAVCDSPPLQLQCARRFADLQRSEQAPLWRGERYGHERIRLAYVSADFLEHPTSYLMAGVFEKHDRRCFETIGISLRDEDSPTARRVKSAFERFIVVERRPDHEIARLIRDLQIDIVVDLMGYTGEHRAGIFTRRPAPLQVNYLGFPATMGCTDMDYIIADRFLIPEEERTSYAEHVVYLPDCFQANDDRRPVAETPSRAQAGLPDTGFVWCSFHSSYKLNPVLFDVWGQLLCAVPDSVLWLVGGSRAAQENLRREARARGVDPLRLVFARGVPYPQHLARLPLADLCLDTIPFNGGATGSDALWAGVPVVTCSGKSYAARMTGSLLHALGLPGLVTHSLPEYRKLALQLALDRGRLSEVRATLSLRKNTSPLFDTDRFRRHLEAAYRAMIARHETGQRPADLAIPAIPP